MTNYEYDAFLSFAVEDKEIIAQQLYEALEERGLKIWYSGGQFKLGTSIQDQIKTGLEKSRFGILLISPHYFQTNWAQKELGALWAKERDCREVIIPVFHNITPEEVGKNDPHLAERWSVLTSIGIRKVAEQIYERIQQAKGPLEIKKLKWRRLLLSFTLPPIFAVLAVFWWTNAQNDLSEEDIKEAVTNRMEQFQNQLELKLEVTQKEIEAMPATTAMVQKQLTKFNKIKARYRNYYYFENGYISRQFEKHVGPATGLDFKKWSAANDYGFRYPKISMTEEVNYQFIDVWVFYFNTQPSDYLIETIVRKDSLVIATVRYSDPLRLVSFHYEYGRWTSFRKHTTYAIQGYLRRERYHFILTSGDWELSHIE